MQLNGTLVLQAEPQRVWDLLLDMNALTACVPGVDNLFVAAGHYRSGIQLSPGTGLAASRLQPGSISREPSRRWPPAMSIAPTDCPTSSSA